VEGSLESSRGFLQEHDLQTPLKKHAWEKKRGGASFGTGERDQRRGKKEVRGGGPRWGGKTGKKSRSKIARQTKTRYKQGLGETNVRGSG